MSRALVDSRVAPAGAQPAGARVGAPAPPEGARPPTWLVWAALWTIYLVWGSTYLAIRVMVETIPPLLGAGVRFVLAGAVAWALLSAARGRRRVALTGRELAACLVVGTLLMGANGLVTVAEQVVPSGLAALVIASVPLWVIALRALAGEAVGRSPAVAVVLGFAGVGVLALPGHRPADAATWGLLVLVAAAAAWALGSFASPRVRLPRDPLTSGAAQMGLGGLVLAGAGLATGEAADLDPGRISLESGLAFAYLVVFGSWLAFTAYAWLLQNAPLSKVATYAYVNPVVALALGALVLSEDVTTTMGLGAAIVVASVAVVVRRESGGSRRGPIRSLGRVRRR